MSIEIMKYCLVALLSQDADQQAQEANILLSDGLKQSQLVACLESHGEEPETALNNLVDKATNQKEPSIEIQLAGGSGVPPKLEDLQ